MNESASPQPDNVDAFKHNSDETFSVKTPVPAHSLSPSGCPFVAVPVLPGNLSSGKTKCDAKGNSAFVLQAIDDNGCQIQADDAHYFSSGPLCT